jgi:hypothetical protein
VQENQYVIDQSSRLRTPEIGVVGSLKLLDVQVNGIVPTRMRHVIKRFLKRIGFRALKVEHVSDSSPFTMRLLAHGYTSAPVTNEQLSKLQYLQESVTEVLTHNKFGYVPHASKADPELLRQMLAKVEPSLNKIYYTIA